VNLDGVVDWCDVDLIFAYTLGRIETLGCSSLMPDQTNPDPDDTNPWRYKGAHGYYWDSETGTYYVRMRYLNTASGRWTQEDPIRDGLNWYVYCGNNPIMYIDPWGLARVNFTEYIQAQGGTVENIAPNAAGQARVRVTVDGASSNWILNSGYIDDSVLNNRFGWTNPWIPAGQSQAVHMGSHNVGGTGNQHISIVIFSEHGGPLTTGDHAGYFTNRHFGMLYATIGGGSTGGTGRRFNQELTEITGAPTAGMRLVGGINRNSDVNLTTKVFWHDLNVHSVSTINSLFSLTAHYNRHYAPQVAYGLIPGANSRYYNSSSFSHGLLLAAGVTGLPDLRDGGFVVRRANISFPGWDKPLPLRAFTIVP
jgi:RHS repeat-associated protein